MTNQTGFLKPRVLAMSGSASAFLFLTFTIVPPTAYGQLAPLLPLEISGNQDIVDNPENPFASGGGGVVGSFLPSPVAPTSETPREAAAQDQQQAGREDAEERGGLQGFGFGAEFGTFSVEGTNIRRYVLPLSYEIPLDESNTINLDAPLSLATIEGNEAYSGSFGVGISHTAFDGVLRTSPEARVGFVSSNAASTGAFVYGASLTNEVFLYGDDFDIGQLPSGFLVQLGNTISHFRVEDVSALQDDGLAYSYKQTVVRNGVAVTYPLTAFGQDLATTLFVTDTRFVGDETFVDQFNEIGLAFRWDDPPLLELGQPINLGVTYTRSEEGSGVRVNFGYRF